MLWGPVEAGSSGHLASTGLDEGELVPIHPSPSN